MWGGLDFVRWAWPSLDDALRAELRASLLAPCGDPSGHPCGDPSGHPSGGTPRLAALTTLAPRTLLGRPCVLCRPGQVLHAPN